MARTEYDIVIIGDFRFPGGAASGPGEQIRVQAAAGYRTGLIQVKAPVLKYPHPFNPTVRRALDTGWADLVDPDRAVSARMVLAFHPQVFTHMPERPLRVEAETRVLVASHPLLDGAGQPYYDWAAIDANVQEALGGGVRWAPLGPLVRAQFPHVENPPPLFERNWLEIVDIGEWRTERRGFCDGRPIIGRHSRPDPLKWPDDRRTTLAAYPGDPACRVRVLGGGPFLDELIGPVPANWEVLPFKSMEPAEFLGGIDFFVYHHNSLWVEAFGRVIIEAMASGALAVLPPHFRPLCGEAAVYGEAADVRDIVSTYYRDFRTFKAQTDTAYEVLHRDYSHEAHTRRLGELIGPPRPSIAAVGKPVPERRHHVLFLTSNGIGMGHLTRMLAVARRCGPAIRPVFATMSQALKIVEEHGFLAEYIPFHAYLECEPNTWNHFLREEINELIAFYEPRVLVFDGNVAYGGLVRALEDNPACLALWCRRAMWRPGVPLDDMIGRETAFHGVIEPGEIAAAYDAGLTTEYRDLTRAVAPIRLLDEHEMLDREEAMHQLGLDAARPAVLLELGSGNNFDTSEVRSVVLARLLEEEGIQPVVAEWLISENPIPLPPGVKRLSLHPISRYLRAFDFVVSAAGYNSFHELLLAGIPAIFVPNEHPTMDEQLTRAQYAERKGLGLCLRTRHVYKARPHVERMLDADFRAAVRSRLAGLSHANGAVEAATFIEELVHTVRADDEARGFWSPIYIP